MKADPVFPIRRRSFLGALVGGATCLWATSGCQTERGSASDRPVIDEVLPDEDVFGYIERKGGGFSQRLYLQIVGAASEYKEGDDAIGVSAVDDVSRRHARLLLANTRVGDLVDHPFLDDRLGQALAESTAKDVARDLASVTLGGLKTDLLTGTEETFRRVRTGLRSEVIGCLVKLFTNAELVALSQRIWNKLPGTYIGAKGFLGARLRPNSPTDYEDAILMQVLNGFAYAVGDVVLAGDAAFANTGVSVVSKCLSDIQRVFGLSEVLPVCATGSLDQQAKAAGPGAMLHQRLAGTDAANAMGGAPVESMLAHADARTQKFGLSLETGQGQEFLIGEDFGVDMVVLAARQLGFARALKHRVAEAQKKAGQPPAPWVLVHAVAGALGSLVFRNKDQLVRCCLEDLVMGKLHGLTMGLDVSTSVEAEISLDDLDDCLTQVTPANPAFLIAMPTKRDPTTGLYSTSFQDHVRLRETFGLHIAATMEKLFQDVGVLDKEGKPTSKFGNLEWMFWQYIQRKAPGSMIEPHAYGRARWLIQETELNGAWLSRGHGATPAEMPPELAKRVYEQYQGARKAVWAEWRPNFYPSLIKQGRVNSLAQNRRDYLLRPRAGEFLDDEAIRDILKLRFHQAERWRVQLLFSDGLCPEAMTDWVHLEWLTRNIIRELVPIGQIVAPEPLSLRGGRVRAGYRVGELLYRGRKDGTTKLAIVHILGQRPDLLQRAYSVYVTIASADKWSVAGLVGHSDTRVYSGIEVPTTDSVRVGQDIGQDMYWLMKCASGSRCR